MKHAARPVPAMIPYLAAVPDPRQPGGTRHPLPAILPLSCAAMLTGCDSLRAIAEWGRDPAGGAPLAARLGFTRATSPCVATLHRVFKTIDVAAFERAVGAWAQAVEAARAAPRLDGHPGVGPAQHRADGDGHDIQEVMPPAAGDARVRQAGKLGA